MLKLSKESAENLRDVIGIGFFIVGVAGVLKEEFTIFTSVWLLLGCLWFCAVLYRIFVTKSAYTKYVVFFSGMFIIGYLIGCHLQIFSFEPEDLIYWYVMAVIVGSMIYHLERKERKNFTR